MTHYPTWQPPCTLGLPRWQRSCTPHPPLWGHSRDSPSILPKMAAHPPGLLSSLQHAHGLCLQSLGVPSLPKPAPSRHSGVPGNQRLELGAGQFPETGKPPQPRSRGRAAQVAGRSPSTGSFSPLWACPVCERADGGDLEAAREPNYFPQTHYSKTAPRNKFLANSSNFSSPFADYISILPSRRDYAVALTSGAEKFSGTGRAPQSRSACPGGSVCHVLGSPTPPALLLCGSCRPPLTRTMALGTCVW